MPTPEGTGTQHSRQADTSSVADFFRPEAQPRDGTRVSLPTAYDRLIGALRDHDSTVVSNGDRQARAQCPAHGDRNPSLSITGTESRTLVFCHSGCDTRDVLAALGLTMADLYDQPRGDTYATYPYPGDRRVHRKADKSFPQSGNKADRSLFHADRIGDASVVYVVEGEEDVFAVESAGGVAVCSAMGAGKARKADWSPLKGKTVIVVADKDAAGRKHAAQVAELLDGSAESVNVVEAATGKDAADHIAAGHTLDELVPVVPVRAEPPSSSPTEPTGDGEPPRRRLEMVRLSDVEEEEIEWLWLDRLPVGMLVTLDGDPGVGKSTLASVMAAVITTGGQWPDGTRCEKPGDVIVLTAEESAAKTIRPRMRVQGGDHARVHVVQGIRAVDGTLQMPTLADIEALREAILSVEARLLIVDVLMAYLPNGVDAHRDQDVRQVLSRLSAVADETGCTIMLLRHLNKTTGGPALYRGGGSIGILGATRVGMLLAADPDHEGSRVLAGTKSNVAALPVSLSYRLVPQEGSRWPKVEWTGVAEYDATALLADDRMQGSTQTDEAAAWLKDYLTENGPSWSQDVKKRGQGAGFGERTLKRAASKLKVKFESADYPRRTLWSLPTPTNTPGPTDPTDSYQGISSGATGPTEVQSGQSGQSGQALGMGPTGPDWTSDTAPPCVVCGKPVTAGQRDDAGRSVHLGCQETGGDSLP